MAGSGFSSDELKLSALFGSTGQQRPESTARTTDTGVFLERDSEYQRRVQAFYGGKVVQGAIFLESGPQALERLANEWERRVIEKRSALGRGFFNPHLQVKTAEDAQAELRRERFRVFGAV